MHFWRNWIIDSYISQDSWISSSLLLTAIVRSWVWNLERKHYLNFLKSWNIEVIDSITLNSLLLRRIWITFTIRSLFLLPYCQVYIRTRSHRLKRCKLKLKLSCQLWSAGEAIYKRGITYSVMICVENVSDDIIRNHNLLQNELLHIQWSQLASVIEMIFHSSRCNELLVQHFLMSN